jgi:hypothetical protein
MLECIRVTSLKHDVVMHDRNSSLANNLRHSCCLRRGSCTSHLTDMVGLLVLLPLRHSKCPECRQTSGVETEGIRPAGSVASVCSIQNDLNFK